MTTKETLQSPLVSGDEKIAFIKKAVYNQTTSLKEKIVADLKAYLLISEDKVFNNDLIAPTPKEIEFQKQWNYQLYVDRFLRPIDYLEQIIAKNDIKPVKTIGAKNKLYTLFYKMIEEEKIIELKRGTKTNLVNIICKYFPHEDGHSFDRVYEALKPSKEERRTGA